jgi:energy-coupling factor transporter ATP-binding protein EcfA2
MNSSLTACNRGEYPDHPGRHQRAGTYRFFDVPVCSHLPLPELGDYCDSAPSVTVRQAAAGEISPAAFKTRYEWRDGAGRLICRCGRRGDDYLLSLPGQASFVIAAAGDIKYLASPDTDEGLLRHLLLNQVLPRYLAHTGKLLLHASAVTLPGGETVAFLGDSGYGKSTLASYCHLQGAHIVDDDCILLRSDECGASIIGGVPTLRLYPDSLRALGHDATGFERYMEDSNKQQMRLATPSLLAPGPRHLDALFLLGAPPPDAAGGVRVESVGGREALMPLLGSVFNLDPTDTLAMSRTFTRVAQVLDRALPVYRLHYPREHGALPQVLRELQRCLGGG